MPNQVFKTEEPVILDGFQAVMKPSQYGYSLTAILDESYIPGLEDDREQSVKWAESKLKNPKRSTLKPEPWEEVAEGKYKVKFSWNENNKPPVVDTEGTHITDENLPVYGSTCQTRILPKALYSERWRHLRYFSQAPWYSARCSQFRCWR